MLIYRDETIVKSNKTISLTGLTKIIFRNTGSVDCKVGLLNIGASESYTISADGGNYFKHGVIDIVFQNKQTGNLIVETYEQVSCNN